MREITCASKLEVVEKKIITIDTVEFEIRELEIAINEMLEHTEPDDHYGDYSLRDYELYDWDATKKLVALGLVSHYIGSRMAKLYCTKDKEAEKEMREILDKIYEFENGDSMESRTLEPCPFCGNPPKSEWLNCKEPTKEPYDWYCGCPDCDMYFVEETQEIAEKKWNTRFIKKK